MEPNRNAFIVGVLVLALIASAVGGGVWMARAGKKEQPERFQVFFVKQSLAGLEAGGSVTMRGIKVGQIGDITIDSDDFTRVKVELSLNPETPVTESTTALIQRNLLTGLAHVELAGSSTTSPRVHGLKALQGEPPEIQEGLPQLVQIQRTVPVILDHADKLLTSAGDILNSDNRDKIARIISNIETVTSGLSDSMVMMQSSTEKLSGVIGQFVTHLDDRTDKVVQGLSRTSSDLSRQVATVSGSLNESLRAITRLVEDLERPQKLILGPSTKDLGPGESEPK